ncbi:TorD/DmsD family molecular chaperone [Brevibacillus sp. SYSU BS000544]|uniref:TorD/DmsD family molecular chaperone n=1 Tax=Brevibacillus sp. SYSU BS000544 TaxID=3416443 RepID=UPI003CE451D2
MVDSSLVNEKIRLKANLYKILSIMYEQPTENFPELFDPLTECIEGLSPNLHSVVSLLRIDFESQMGDLTQLKVAHAKLFIGPFEVQAAPYSSVYLEGDRRVMGESTMFAAEQYQLAGVGMTLDYKEPPDHIVVEMEFLYYLLASYLNSGEERYLEIYKTFLNRHLGLWVKQFTSAIEENASSSFYKYIAIITQQFIKNELWEPVAS